VQPELDVRTAAREDANNAHHKDEEIKGQHVGKHFEDKVAAPFPVEERVG
jgi:hypothetical protein